MENDRFAWDDAKAAATLVLRGVSFSYAATVFDDLAALEFPDRRRDHLGAPCDEAGGAGL